VANYLRPQTVRDVLRSTFAVYGKGFRVIFLSYFLPVLPLGICQNEALAARNLRLYLLILLCSFPVSLFASAAITVSVSDICLGNAPSLVRSYKKVFAVMFKVLGTNILQVIIIYFIIIIGLVPAIIVSFIPAIIAIKLLGISILHFIIIFIGGVPSIIAMLWLIFTPSVVILEGFGGFAALKRSKAIGKGYHWRNLGIIAFLLVIPIVIYVILALAFKSLFPHAVGHFGGRLFDVILDSLSPPLTIIGIVLMYYDLRVRKEAYDAAALAEDLRR
jgi:hypothetical protein